jgi:hypothetical protein
MALALRAGFSALKGGNLEHPFKMKGRPIVRLLRFLLWAARWLWFCTSLFKGTHGSSSVSFQTGLGEFNGATAGRDSISARTRSFIGEVNVGRLRCGTHIIDDNTAGTVSLQDCREQHRGHSTGDVIRHDAAARQNRNVATTSAHGDEQPVLVRVASGVKDFGDGRALCGSACKS